jgi:hypothetical protein
MQWRRWVGYTDTVLSFVHPSHMGPEQGPWSLGRRTHDLGRAVCWLPDEEPCVGAGDLAHRTPLPLFGVTDTPLAVKN